jgi:hypothetical protein
MAECTCMGSGDKGTQLHLLIMKWSFLNANTHVPATLESPRIIPKTSCPLQELDSEGRCLITDHGSFILFNIYGPAITNEDTAPERMAFKIKFYKARFLGAGKRRGVSE